jgi:hypothetical protein
LLARNANMSFNQYAKLIPDDPEDFGYFGRRISTFDFHMLSTIGH